jgi:PKD repeat protein
MKLFLKRILRSGTVLVLAGLLVAPSVLIPLAAQAKVQTDSGKVYEVEFGDKIDRDGDGYYSGFRMSTSLNAKRHKFTSQQKKTAEAVAAIAFGIPGIALFSAGEALGKKVYLYPHFTFELFNNRTEGPLSVAIAWEPQPRDARVYTVGFGTAADESKDDITKTMSDLLYVTPESSMEIQGFTNDVCYEVKVQKPLGKDEERTGCYGLNNEVDKEGLGKTFLFADNNKFKVEQPEDDQLGRVRFTSNVNGVDVIVNGESVGQTPLVNDFPVDITDKQGKARVTFEKDGYHTETKKIALNPTANADQVVDIELDRIMKPVSITSEPEGAQITINGGLIADTTPYKENMWVKNSMDITVSNDNESKTFQNVTAPANLKADLTGQDSSNNNLLDPGLVPGFNPDIFDIGPSSPIIVGDLDIPTPTLPNFDLISANFDANPEQVETGEEVGFDASAAYSLMSSIQAFNWQLGDGTTKGGEKITHSFSDDGTYDVKLSVEDNDGNTGEKTISVTVENRAPDASPTVSNPEPVIGETVTFSASQSSDADGSVDAYEWIVDGQNIGNGETLEHTFTAAGEKTVSLTVTDDDGKTDTTQLKVRAQEKNQLPEASFEVSSSEVEVGEEVLFDASKSTDDEGIQVFAWDFGDGNADTGASVRHAFESEGDYPVELVVTDTDGERTKVSKTVTVGAGGEVDTSYRDQQPEDESGEQAEQSADDEGKGFFGRLMDWLKDVFRGFIEVFTG